MIDIKWQPGKKVAIKGHAGYADIGHDIVCAAISTLYCTMIMARGIGGDREGDSMTAVCVSPMASDTFDLFCAGMREVARQYPTFVRFTREKYDLGQEIGKQDKDSL